jgi:hypothetical protein
MINKNYIKVNFNFKIENLNDNHNAKIDQAPYF